MNNCSFNDTFDNISFSTSGQLIKNVAVSKNIESNVISNSISFDDSLFLTESFSISAITEIASKKNGTEKSSEETFIEPCSPENNIQNISTTSLPKMNQSFNKLNITINRTPLVVDKKVKCDLNSSSNILQVQNINENKASAPKHTNKDILDTEVKNMINEDGCKSDNSKYRDFTNNTEVNNVIAIDSITKGDHHLSLDNIDSSKEGLISDVNSKCINVTEDMCKLSSWGLPETILEKYRSHNITTMFSWQAECLSKSDVLQKNKNLVYSAPTSAGKTLVAEILAIKTVLERHKKVIFILPFVSVVREKMFYFQDILGSSGVRVEGFMGSYNPPGGFQTVQVAICTIEKANSLINRMLEEGILAEIGAVVVDEMHLLGDSGRGYLLELLLTKLRYMSLKNDNVNIQIIGMSATLPNLNLLAKWLDAELYTTQFRPIPLYEQCHVNGEIYNNELKFTRKLTSLPELEKDTDNVLQLCLETIFNNCSILIFCPTKNWCENLAQQIAAAFLKLGRTQTEMGLKLRKQINFELITELLEQLKRSPVGLDTILNKTTSFGVAFHHAGLTMDERDIIEGGFRTGSIRVLVATSTLSSGVNLPARRVIIRSPMFYGKPIDTLTYKQMVGRAGRMGKDTAGESILICQKNDYKVAKELMSAKLQPIESCLEGSGKLKRAILEVVASGVATTPSDVRLFTNCTLLAYAEEGNKELNNPIDESINFLTNNELIRLQLLEDGTSQYIATPLAKACLSSSMPPEEGLALFAELEKARQCFVLETELHLIYLVTPYTASNQLGNIDWMLYLDMWEKLPASMKRVGELIGIKVSYIINASRGKIQSNTAKLYHQLQIHKRFYTALALQDLVNEIPLGEVANKFNCNRGMLQSLQQSAATFAAMVTSFSRQLGWSSVELLIAQFQDRLQFGISRDLLDLMKLSILNGQRARAIFNGGLETLVDLAGTNICKLENILHKVVPFESEKERDGESEYATKQRNKIRTIWITGMQGLTEREAAAMIIEDARKYLQLEMGISEARWASLDVSNNNEIINNRNVSHVQVIVEEDAANSNKSISNNVTNKIISICNLNTQLSNESLSTSTGNISGLTKLNESINSNNISANISIISSNNNSFKTPKQSRASNVSMNTDSSISLNLSSNSRYNLRSRNSSLNNSSKLESKKEVLNSSSQSLFDDSLGLDSNILHNISAAESKKCSSSFQIDSLLENAFSSSFKAEEPVDSNMQIVNISDTIESSQDLSNKINAINVNKRCRINNSCDSEEDLFIDQTPTKKSKLSMKPRSQRLNSHIDATYIISQNEHIVGNINIVEATSSVDLTHFEIISVCNDQRIFESFKQELLSQTDISVSIGCRKVLESKQIIGTKIMLNEVVTEKKKPVMSFKNREVVCLSISWGRNNAYFIDFESTCVNSKQTLGLLKNIFKNDKLNVKMFDSKEFIKVLKQCCDIDFNCKCEDPKVADWMLEPEEKEKNLQAMTIKYAPEAINLCQLGGNSKGVGSIALDLSSTISHKIRSSIEAIICWHLINALKDLLYQQDIKLLHTYAIEMSCMVILSQMELYGFGIDTKSLQNFADNIKEYTTSIEKKAFQLAGRHFSFTSSVDVAKILRMYKGKRVSTNKQVLEQNVNPISKLIIQWRKLNSTLTKMVYPLLRSVENNRIHGCCITHNSTGRIAMQDPNLQNIPRDFDFVNPVTGAVHNINCRKAFVAQNKNVLVSADYCQLELRLLAHLSQDNTLCSLMQVNEDVFRSIAAKWNTILESDVSDLIRQRTKQLCYGIIYGMGMKTLSEQLDLSDEETIEFIETFHQTYPAIKKYINEVVRKCKECGFVVTLAGRRRYLPHINHTHGAVRSQAERQAVNTTIQGSAADIAKNAMVLVANKINDKFKNSKNKPILVLQLHDELLYEVPSKYSDVLANILKKYMQNSVKLSVPFPVRVKSGKSWGDMKELNI